MRCCIDRQRHDHQLLQSDYHSYCVSACQLKGNSCQNVTLCHPGQTCIFNFWHSCTLALSHERQSARMSEIKNVGLTCRDGIEQFYKCNHLMPLHFKGFKRSKIQRYRLSLIFGKVIVEVGLNWLVLWTMCSGELWICEADWSTWRRIEYIIKLRASVTLVRLCVVHVVLCIPRRLLPQLGHRSFCAYFAITSSLSIKWFNFRSNLFSSAAADRSMDGRHSSSSSSSRSTAMFQS